MLYMLFEIGDQSDGLPFCETLLVVIDSSNTSVRWAKLEKDIL